jgi:predicted GNAT family acetyltransferase
MTFADLPGQGEQLALSFDGSAEELGHYFMESEALYDWHTVTTDLHKKQGALKYLTTAALKRIWRASNTFMDAAKTYEDFKKEIHKYYSGSSKDIYTIHHLDTLIGRRV